MKIVTSVAAWLCVLAVPVSVRGQSVPDVPANLLPVRYTLAGGMTQSLLRPAGFSPYTRPGAVGHFVARTERPKALVPLYISMAALQGLDIYSTREAPAAGGREGNPMVAPIVGSTPALFALKAGVSGAMIFTVERLWKTNRKAAILTLIGTNIGYAAIVSHNVAIAASRPGTR